MITFFIVNPDITVAYRALVIVNLGVPVLAHISSNSLEPEVLGMG